MTAKADQITYSEWVRGNRGNHSWPVTFDMTGDGYLGVTQKVNMEMHERVLLSRAQVHALLKFIADWEDS